MANFFDALAGGGAAEGGDLLQLSDKEKREFDEITFDKIQAMTDVNKVARLEAYMRREEFYTTADVAQARMESLRGSARKGDAPSLPARKDSDAELDKVLQELKSWEASVKGADKALKDDAPLAEDNGAPIRRHIGGKVGEAGLIEEPEQTKPKNAKEVVEKAKRVKDAKDVRSGAEYYKKWDKVADNLEKDSEDSPKAAKPATTKPGTGSEEAPEESSVPVLSAAAADRLVEAAWKKPVVEREWLANREREKGNELFKSHEYNGSIAAYTLAIRLLPTSASAFSNRAAAQLKLKQYKEAEADCTKALELDPGYLKALRRRGTARLEMRNATGAIVDLERAQQLDPESTEVADLLQKARAKVGSTETNGKPMTRMKIEEVEDEEESAAETHGRKVETESDAHEPIEDEKVGRERVVKGRSNGHVETGAEVREANGGRNTKGNGKGEKEPRGSLERMETDRSQARDFDSGARGSSPGSGSKDSSKGGETRGEGDASAKSEAVGEKQPTVHAVGVTNEETSKEADAARLAEEWREKGNLLYKRGDFTGADACYTHSLTYSRTAAALSNRAMCRNRVGRFREAEEDASAAIIADPSYVKAYHRRAAARRGLNKKEQAMEDYKVVLEAMPNNAGLQEEVRSLQGELEESMYIPPRRGAPVIEEVEEVAPTPPTRAPQTAPQDSISQPVYRAPQPCNPPSHQAKPAEEQAEPPSEEAQPSPGNAERAPPRSKGSRLDRNRTERNGVSKSPALAEEVQADTEEAGSISVPPEQAEAEASVSKSKEGAAEQGKGTTAGNLAAPKTEAPSTSGKKRTFPEETPSPTKPSASELEWREEAEREKEAGNRLFKNRDVAGALKHYSRAIELQPGNAAFYGNRAMCYLQLKEYERVVGDSSRALELDPGYTKAYYRRALARKGLGQYEAALEDLKFVQEKLPKDKQVTEEVLTITDLYMRRFENLTSSPGLTSSTPVTSSTSVPTAAPKNNAPVGSETGTKSQPPGQKASEPSTPAKTVLPTWLKEQLAEQVKQGGLRAGDPTGVSAPPKSSLEKEPVSGGVVRNVGSLTDEIIGSKPSFFESNQARPEFSAGSFDKKAGLPKTSPRGSTRKRSSPRSVVATAVETETPPNEREEETAAAAPPDKVAKVEASGADSEPKAGKGVKNGAKVEAEAARRGGAPSSTAKVESKSAEVKALPAKPRSALEVERACASLREPKRIAAYLQTIDPASYPSIIKENLSAVLMTHVGTALSALPVGTSADVMGGLAGVSRFKLVWMLLSPATKKLYTAALERARTEAVALEVQQKLAKAYR